MRKKILELENDFVTFAQYGQFILNCTKNEIKEHFLENEIIILPDLHSDELMEIRLSYGTLTCLINNDNNSTCYLGFLFFDDSSLFNVYKEICNDQCEIIAPNVWKYNNYYIELKSYNFDFYFTFCMQLQYNAFERLF